MKIRYKILIGYVLIALLTQVIARISELQLNHLDDKQQESAEISQQLRLIQSMVNLVQETRFYVDRFLQLHQKEDNQQAQEKLQGLKDLVQRVADGEKTPQRRLQYERIQKLLNPYEAKYQNLVLRIGVLDQQIQGFMANAHRIQSEIAQSLQTPGILPQDRQALRQLSQDLARFSVLGTHLLFRYEATEVEGMKDGLEEMIQTMEQIRDRHSKKGHLKEQLEENLSQLEDLLDAFDGATALIAKMNEEVQQTIEPIAPQIVDIANTINDSHWLQEATASKSLQASFSSALDLIHWLAGATLLVGIALALFFSAALTKPIVLLQKLAQELAQGNLEQEIPVQGKDELASLAQSFREMRDAIKTRITDLDLLNRTGQVLAASLEQQKALEVTLLTLRTKFQAPSSRIYLWDQEGQLCLAQGSGPQPEAATKLDRAEALVAQALDQLQAVWVKEPDHRLLVPLVDDQSPLGLIELVGLPQGGLESTDIKFAETLGQIAVTTLKNIRFLEVIEEHNRTLEAKVKERTQAIRDLMDNTGQGFLSFSQDHLVQPEYSKACEAFFGQSPAGQPALELLFGEEAASVAELTGMLFEQEAELEILQEMFPAEIKAGSRILQAQYRWIEAHGKLPAKMMVILTDVTQQRALEALLKADEERNEMIIKVAVDRDGFLQFLREVEDILEQIASSCNKSPDQVNPNELFRHFHTIKGGSASYGLKHVAHQAHAIESDLEPVRGGGQKVTMELIAHLRQGTDELNRILKESLYKLSNLIPPEELEQAGQVQYRVPKEKVERLKNLVRQSGADPESMRQAVAALARQPMAPLLKKYASDAQSIAQKLNKEIQVVLQGAEVEVEHEPMQHLFSTLIHLIRNSVDHGIEEPMVRQMLGKPEAGKITLECQRQGEDFVLKISDDGGGIDPERILRIAVAKGLLDESKAASLPEEEAIKLIFAPGFSTKEEVSDLSGRGVGMDAVNAAVEALGGEIRVESTLDQGTCFTIFVPKGGNLRQS